jgi:hypothetical protein
VDTVRFVSVAGFSGTWCVSLKSAAKHRFGVALGSETVAQFLARGASKAVDIIYQAVGPVGPPIRPGSGSLFIVDERRLTNWRQDGYRLTTLNDLHSLRVFL